MKTKPRNSPPLSSLTVTGAGIAQTPVSASQTSDPYAGMTAEEKTAYFLESLLYYAQQSAPGTLSPHTKGVYYLIAYSPLALFGFHKFYIGKCLQGLCLNLLSVLLAAISGGMLLALSGVIVLVWVLVETYRDWTGSSPPARRIWPPLAVTARKIPTPPTVKKNLTVHFLKTTTKKSCMCCKIAV